MSNAKTRISGIGHRYAIIGELGSDGLPKTGSSTAVPHTGTLIERVKNFSPSDPSPRRETHMGDDLPYAQDSLPPSEIGSFTISTSQVNLSLEALVSGQRVVELGAADKAMAIGVNTNKRGSEPRVFYLSYRQALDTGKGSSTSGSLRQWEVRIYPSVQITPSSHGFEAGATDKTYQATPTPTGKTIWGEEYSEATWGFTQGEAISIVTNYQPRVNWWRGNGTLNAFQLSHPPVNANALKVWVAGASVTPTSVNTSSANPAFTLATPPANDAFIFALIETNEPGNS